MINLLSIGSIIALIGIIMIAFLPLRYKITAALYTVLAFGIITSIQSVQVLMNETFHQFLFHNALAGDVFIKIDALSAWFILIINFTTATGLFFGKAYLRSYLNGKYSISLHAVVFILFHISMVGVCVVDNMFIFLLVWELMSVSSLLLVLFDNTKPSVIKAGINYFVQMHLAVLLISIAVIWSNSATGIFSFSGLAKLAPGPTATALFFLFFTGFGLKAGFMPLHSWLPHAHPAAPAHVSGVMSGVMVKLGIYGILRVVSALQVDYMLVGEVVLSLSVLTALYGILNASVHRDYKRLLAYCTIENVGIAGIGIGTGLIGRGTGSELMMLLGYGGALLHVLNHSLYKSLLFYASGSVYLATHTLNMEHLGGIIKKMPRTSVLFLIGAFAITGLPPFNGFVSEFLIYSGLAYGIQINSVKDTMLFILAFAGMALTGGIAILAFTRAFSTIFLGMPRTTAAENVKETDWQQLAPLYVIVLIMILIACSPYLYFPALTKAIAILASSAQTHPEWEVYPQILSSVSIFSLVFAGIVAVVWFVRSRLIKTADIRVEPTWGCGYTKMSPKLQYTGKSFSKPLAKIFSFILLENKSYTEIEAGELFPGNRNYNSHYSDFWEQFLIQPLVNRMDKWTNLLGFIHNGRIQSYVLYGIVFMLIMLIITFANLAP